MASLLVAGCNTVTKTLDFSKDPRLDPQGGYPNINVAGPTQPGKLLTPEQQAATKQALAAEGAAISPAAGSAAKAEGAASAQQLQDLARTHGEKTLQEIQAECAAKAGADATKCPQ